MRGQIADLLNVTNVLVSVTFWVSFAFPAVTALFWPWWKSWWGRNIVALELCIAVTLLPSVALRYFGLQHEALQLLWVQTIALGFVPCVVLWRVVMIWYGQRKGTLAHRNGEKDRDKSPAG